MTEAIKSLLWIAIATAFALPGCGQKRVRLEPGSLQEALTATGDQRRVLFENLLRSAYYDPNVRIAAVEELSRIGSSQSIEPLVNALLDSNMFVRTASHRALMRMGEPAMKALLTRLKVKDDPSRLVMATFLAASVTVDTERALSKELLDEILMETRFVRCLGELCIERASIPVYPSIAESARVRGKVRVDFSLRNGHPEEVLAVGPPLLRDAAMATVRQCRFTPENSAERYHMILDFELPATSEGGSAYDFVFPNYIRIAGQTPVVNVSTVAAR